MAVGWNQEKKRYHSYHLDEQYSTAYLTDEAGSVQNSYQYGAFGDIQNKQENIHNRILYTGQQYDQVSEQYYLRARFYNPVVGRFLLEDVYREDGLNLYAYCANNPVMYYDPSGYAEDYRDTNNDKRISTDSEGGKTSTNRTSSITEVENNLEDFYRAMSDKEFNRLQKNKILTKREKGFSELKITRQADYVLEDLSQRKKQRKNYTNIVKFEVVGGTEKKLPAIGATHISARNKFPDLPVLLEEKGKVELKYERKIELWFRSQRRRVKDF